MVLGTLPKSGRDLEKWSQKHESQCLDKGHTVYLRGQVWPDVWWALRDSGHTV